MEAEDSGAYLAARILLSAGTVRNTRQEMLTINTQTIDPVLLNKRLNPFSIGRYHHWVLGVHVRQRDLGVAKPTFLNARDVVPIHGTIRVILRLVKRFSTRLVREQTCMQPT